jgi:hypothetical protein
LGSKRQLTYISWRNGTGSGWCSNLVGEDLVTDGLEIVVGENESNIASDVRKKTLILWGIRKEALDGTTDLYESQNHHFHSTVDCVSYHGVLSHQDNALTTEGLTNLVHLLGADIVNGDDEDAAILLEKALQLIEIAGLVCGLAPHIFLK